MKTMWREKRKGIKNVCSYKALFSNASIGIYRN